MKGDKLYVAYYSKDYMAWCVYCVENAVCMAFVSKHKTKKEAEAEAKRLKHDL